MSVTRPTDSDDATVAAAVAGPIPVLVDFRAPWCGPCRMVAPVLEAVAAGQSGRRRVVRLNVDENRATAAAHGVQGLPALHLLEGGAPVAGAVGCVPKEQLAAALAPYRAREVSP